jgi:hypothetical protein
MSEIKLTSSTTTTSSTTSKELGFTNCYDLSLKELFKDNLIVKKKIYDFHYQLASIHLSELLSTKTTLCKSGFIREILYKKLDQLGIKYKLEIAEYKKTRTLCRWSRKNIFYTPSMLYGYIQSNMILLNELLDSKNDYCNNVYHISVEDIISLFDKNNHSDKFERDRHKYQRIALISDELDYKWNIFEHCFLYRPIKRITLI